MTRLRDAWFPAYQPTEPVEGNVVACCQSFPPDSRHVSVAEQRACFRRQAAHLMVSDPLWWNLTIMHVAPWRDDA
jgi:hypothetical protein